MSALDIALKTDAPAMSVLERLELQWPKTVAEEDDKFKSYFVVNGSSPNDMDPKFMNPRLEFGPNWEVSIPDAEKRLEILEAYVHRCRKRIREVESDPLIVDIFDRVFAANGVVGMIDGPIDTLIIDTLFHTKNEDMDFPYSTKLSYRLIALEAAAKSLGCPPHEVPFLSSGWGTLLYRVPKYPDLLHEENYKKADLECSKCCFESLDPLRREWHLAKLVQKQITGDDDEKGEQSSDDKYSEVVSMRGGTSFNQLLSNWDVASVADMQGMFNRAYSSTSRFPGGICRP